MGALLTRLCCCCCKSKPWYQTRLERLERFRRARQLLYQEQDFINIVKRNRVLRLLQKEREEREIDERFNHQKEEIIAKAKQLDEEKKQFLQQQREVKA